MESLSLQPDVDLQVSRSLRGNQYIYALDNEPVFYSEDISVDTEQTTDQTIGYEDQEGKRALFLLSKLTSLQKIKKKLDSLGGRCSGNE